MSRRTLGRDEATLALYLDRELDAAQAAEVEVWLAEDGAARCLLETMEVADRHLRAALDPVLDEPTPAQLLRRIEASAAGRGRAPVVAGRGFSWHGWMPWALVTVLALLALGLPATWFFSHDQGRLDERLAQSAAAEREARVEASLEAALQQALEGTVSGDSLPWLVADQGKGSVQPIRTYKSTAGQWCREYRIDVTADGEARSERGIACRTAPTDGTPARWERKVLFFDNAPMPAADQAPT